MIYQNKYRPLIMAFKAFYHLVLDSYPAIFPITSLHQPYRTTGSSLNIPTTVLPLYICLCCYPGWCSYFHVFTRWSSIRPSRLSRIPLTVMLPYLTPQLPAHTHSFTSSLSHSFTSLGIKISPFPTWVSPKSLCEGCPTRSTSYVFLLYPPPT